MEGTTSVLFRRLQKFEERQEGRFLHGVGKPPAQSWGRLVRQAGFFRRAADKQLARKQGEGKAQNCTHGNVR